MTIDTADHALHRSTGLHFQWCYQCERDAPPSCFCRDSKPSDYHRAMLAERARFEAQAQAARGERV